MNKELNRNDARQILYAAIGESLFKWSLVEEHVFHVFVRMTRPALFKATSAAFHSVPNFGTKLEMTNQACIIALTQEIDLIEWQRIFKKLSKLSTSRNKIAHFSFNFHVYPNEIDVGWLSPKRIDFRTKSQELINDSLRQPRYDLKWIRNASLAFDQASTEVAKFADRFEPPPTRRGEWKGETLQLPRKNEPAT